MKVLIINGSPKGKYSITLQTCRYLEALHPEIEFDYFNEAVMVKALEKDFSIAKEKIEKNDLIIFSYPVYTFIVPSQLHRFIELLKESGMDLSDKYVTQITTSKHFYDVTAHRFIEENCRDLNMKYIKGLSADMDDLKSKKGQKEARDFFDFLLWQINGSKIKTTEKTVALVCDLANDDEKLLSMIEQFKSEIGYQMKEVNIHDFPFKGGCLNCFNCSKDGKCIYNDGFQDLLTNEIQSCDGIVLAYTIKDHSMGYNFKLYDDRQFCNGHRTVTMGKPFGYLVSGELSKEENLRMIMEARAETGGNYLCGIASNEKEQDATIKDMVSKLQYALENEYRQSANFYGVGGMKIFRDLIWLMQGVMRADHKFFKQHGQYDFPQNKKGTMLAMYAAGYMMNNKKIKRKLGNKLNDGMIAGYQKIIDEAKENGE